MKIGKKLYLSFGVIVGLLLLCGLVAFWSIHTMNTTSQEAQLRLQQINALHQMNFWMVKQYQHQADLIINQDMDIVNDFDESVKQMDTMKAIVVAAADTPDEKRWVEELNQVDEQFDTNFHNAIVPEVKRTLEKHIQQYDAEADQLISEIEGYANKIFDSMQNEFQEAVALSQDTELAKRAQDMIAINQMLFWLIKQYQNQADLIINQDPSIVEDFQTSVEKMDEYKRIVAEAVDTPQEKAWLAKIDELDQQFDTLFFTKVKPEVDYLLKNETIRLDGISDNLLFQAQEISDKIAASISNEVDEAQKISTDAAALSYKAISFFILLAVILAAILAWKITKSIVDPMNIGVNMAQKVAKGDLTTRIEIHQKDEIGLLANALNDMVENLRTVMSHIQTASQQVASSSEELSASSQSLANASTEQAASIEETSASIEELTSSVQQNAVHAQKTSVNSNECITSMNDMRTKTTSANSLCESTVQLAKNGGGIVNSMVESMGMISDSSKKIADIIKVIDDIADQTNLLALNAAIEAARAGEMGKGFAVVAVEVRKLAERSQQAAKEISGMITDSVKRVADGAQLANQCGESLHEIVKAIINVSETVKDVTDSNEIQIHKITETAQLVQDIAAACEEQSSGAEQITSAIVQLDQVTQQNSSTAEEISSSSVELSAQAQNLQEMVSRFNINADGQSPFYTPSAHPAQKQPTSIASIEHKPLVPRSDHPQKESFKSFPPQKDASPQYESDDEFGHF